jgi:Transposase IS66 family
MRDDHAAARAVPLTPRGFASLNLLAMILFEKFGQHQPLNRQSERYAREGVDLSLLTLADQVGACALALRPLCALIEAHVFSAERLYGDDTTVQILAKGKTETGRVWTYVRHNRPFGGKDPPTSFVASTITVRLGSTNCCHGAGGPKVQSAQNQHRADDG